MKYFISCAVLCLMIVFTASCDDDNPNHNQHKKKVEKTRKSCC